MPVWGPADYVPEIRPFEPPYFFRISQCQKWGAAVTDEMRGDELLWRTYWKRFNTVEIPILPQDEFFDTALSIAKLAGGRRAEFERIFEERNRQRWGEVKRQLGKTEYHAKRHKEAFPCEDARKKMIRVCQTGCLTHFLDILKGNTYGYEADVVREESPNKAPNSLDEMQTPNEEYFDEDGLPRSQMFNYDPDICFYEEPSTKDWREPLMADNVFYIGSYAVDYAPPELNDGDEGALNPETGRTSSKLPRLSRSASTPRKGDEEKTTEPMTQKKRKRKSVRFDDADVESHQHQHELDPEENDDDNDRAHKRARLDAPPPHTSSLAQPAADENVTKKRMRHDDDHNDRQKRQKLETPTTPVPAPHISSPILTATDTGEPRRTTRHSRGHNRGVKRQSLEDPASCPPTPSASSSTTATGSTASRKRLREGDDYDNGFKRQKIEDTSASAPPFYASSSTQQTPDKSIDDQKEAARENQKRRTSSTRQPRKRPPPPTKSLNTRSRRRGGPSTLLELDQSGKPRSV